MPPSLTERIEKSARLLRRRRVPGREPTPLFHLEEEIVLLSERLDRVRAVHQEQLRSILRAECYVDTDLMALETYSTRGFYYRTKARDSLKSKLLALDAERRHATLAHEREVAELHERLLGLLARREYLRV